MVGDPITDAARRCERLRGMCGWVPNEDFGTVDICVVGC
jgi:hypothetical protein